MTQPFRRKKIKWLGFIAHLNLAEISSENVSAISAKSIEGGTGLTFITNEHFSLSITYERIFNPRLRAFIREKEGLVIPELTLDEEDGRFFRDDNLDAIAISYTYRF